MSISPFGRSSSRMSPVGRYCVAGLILAMLLVTSGCGMMGGKRKKHDNTAFSCGERSPAAPH